MIVIGIDPGVETGLAIINDGKLISRCSVDMKNIANIPDIVHYLLVTGAAASSYAVYLETQYFSRTSEKTNWTTIKKLIEVVGWWKYLYISYGITNIIEIQPHTWQSKLLSSQKIKRNELKKLSVQRAQQQWNITEKNHNICDAVNIATYGWQEEVLKRRNKQNEKIKNIRECEN